MKSQYHLVKKMKKCLVCLSVFFLIKIADKILMLGYAYFFLTFLYTRCRIHIEYISISLTSKTNVLIKLIGGIYEMYC